MLRGGAGKVLLYRGAEPSGGGLENLGEAETPLDSMENICLKSGAEL